MFIFGRKYPLVRWIIVLIFAILMIIGLIYLGILSAKEDTQEDFTKKTTSDAPKSSKSSSSSTTNNVPKYKALTAEEKNLISGVIESSEMIGSIPEKYPISLQFFYFQEGQRVWQDKYFIDKTGVISGGDPTIKLTLHAKYIPEFKNNDFCTVITTANKNRDLGFDTEISKTKLLWRYKSLVPYRDCLGF